MLLPSVFLAVLSPLISTAAVIPTAPSSPEGRPTLAICENVAASVPLLRAFSGGGGDHFYTTDHLEMLRATSNGWGYEGIAAFIFNSPAPVTATSTSRTTTPLTAPLYRLWSPRANDHFYTMSLSEKTRAVLSLGYVDEGVVGYLYPAPNLCGSAPIYRLYHHSSRNHFYTMNLDESIRAEKQLGYTAEGVVGYALLPSPHGSPATWPNAVPYVSSVSSFPVPVEAVTPPSSSSSSSSRSIASVCSGDGLFDCGFSLFYFVIAQAILIKLYLLSLYVKRSKRQAEVTGEQTHRKQQPIVRAVVTRKVVNSANGGQSVSAVGEKGNVV